MTEITLIGNTGIQFHKFVARIDSTEIRSQKLTYFEDVDLNKARLWMEPLIHVPDVDMFARKSELIDRGALNQEGELVSGGSYEGVKFMHDAMPHVFEFGNFRQLMKYFEDKWIPLPYFRNNIINKDLFGPTDWVRMMIRRKDETHVELVLAVDTTLGRTDSHVSPTIDENPHENKFKLCDSEELILAFLGDASSNWIEDYLKKLVPHEEGESKTKYLAAYIFLTRILGSMERLPSIHLLSDNAGLIDVDLVLDIGNSRTCGLLFENPNDLSFNLNRVKQLEIIDLTDPFSWSADSFSTRLVFKEAEFGNLDAELNQNKKFQWKSLVRVGNEAERVINNANVESSLVRESMWYNSSPKRYLWDIKQNSKEWTFYNRDSDIPETVYKTGISEQLKSDGSLCEDGIFGTRASYSRRSLMTFVYLEIIAHAVRQINSFEFRITHGQPANRRRIKRIVISCPTAMVREEQLALRNCASEAVSIYENFDKCLDGNFENFNSTEESTIEIVPDINDLRKNSSDSESRKDWNYDEATVAQLLFMYGSIQHKFDGNPDLFFRLFGKKIRSSGERELVVGSLDIGAGTSDLMICKYSYSHTDATEITPEPLYWESFGLAGDELLKNIIQEVIIEGRPKNEEENGCSGVIREFGESNGHENMILKLNGFFGQDNANIDYRARMMRIHFVNQIGVPIALKLLSIANNVDNDNIELNYSELFEESKPSSELLDYFEKHFDFRFEEIKWKLSAKKVNEIIRSTFSRLLGQISSLMHLYKCDIVILAGRPCSFKSLEQEFLKNQVVTPNRLINLNHYWVGKWYPFADDNGFIKDPKTVVTVGSLLALMGGRLFKLDKFRFNTNLLKSKLVSTANFLGGIENGLISYSSMSPKDEEASFMVYDLPFHIGFKNLDSSNYPARNLLSLNFNNKNIAEQLAVGNELNTSSAMDKIENRKTKLRSKLPYKVTIERDFEVDKEKIKIQSIISNDEDDLSKNSFELVLQTTDKPEGHWLDTGEFTLTIS